MKALTLIIVLVTLLTGQIFAADYAWAPYHNRFAADTVLFITDTTFRASNTVFVTARNNATGTVQAGYNVGYTDAATDLIDRYTGKTDTMTAIASNSGFLFRNWRTVQTDSTVLKFWVHSGSIPQDSVTGKAYVCLYDGGGGNFASVGVVALGNYNDWRTLPFLADTTAIDSFSAVTGTDTVEITIRSARLTAAVDSIRKHSLSGSIGIQIVSAPDYWGITDNDDSGADFSLVVFGNSTNHPPLLLVYSTEVPQIISYGENNKGVWLDRHTIYGRQPLIMRFPTPNKLNNVGMGFVATLVAGQSDSISYSYRPHMSEVTLNLDTVQIGSPPYSITFLTGDNPPAKSDKWLDFESGAYYHSFDPDATAGSGLEALKPQACRVLEIWAQVGSSDTVDVTTMVSWE